MADHAAHTHAHAPHGDPYYVKVWAVLCVLFAISVIGPTLGIRVVTLVTAFGIALVKAFLVAKHFMHLNIEKRWVIYILLVMIAFMVVFFWGVAPDVMKHGGPTWQKTYVEPSQSATPAH
jgi:caa(3)-type oxidase subunit IV